jgi:hypothetical protein
MSGIATPLETGPINDALISHAQRLGIFDSVNGHEPRRAPGHGLTWSLWIQTIRPFAPRSGLAATALALIYNTRLQIPIPGDAPSLDAMDPHLSDAAIAVMASLSADFTLDGLLDGNLDLLGQTGVQFGLGAEAGYVEHDGTLYRVMTLTIPIICNDIFEQAP